MLREDIGGDLNTPHIGEHGHKIEVHGQKWLKYKELVGTNWRG